MVTVHLTFHIFVVVAPVRVSCHIALMMVSDDDDDGICIDTETFAGK